MMKRKLNNKVIGIAFGANEFGFGLFFSTMIWLQIKRGIYFGTIINLFILASAILVTIWQLFKRKSAVAYLTAFVVRMVYLGSVFMMCQNSAYFETEVENLKYSWLFVTLAILLFSILFHFILEKKNWGSTLKEWENADKLSVSKRYFRINKAFHSHSLSSDQSQRIYTIVPLGIILLSIIMGVLGRNIKTAFLHFIMILLGYFCAFMVGRILVWIIEIRKLEKQLGVTFVTEFGMQEEKAKGKRRRGR